MKLHQYLSQHRKPCPSWLDNFKEKDGFDHQAFFGSRVVYYPGYGSDGQPVKLFGSSHSAHCFVYADSLTPKEQVLANLDSPEKNYNGSFHGYHSLARINLTPDQIASSGWTQHAKLSHSDFAIPQIHPSAF